MIINKLTLENFGLFYGKQSLDLKPTKNKNIILIGGMNGNGKTTIFEAIQLCLYGEKILEKRKNGDYEKYLIDRIHHNPNIKEQPIYASVEVEFQYANIGEVDTFIVTRTWFNHAQEFNEQLKVKKNGKILEELDAEQWQEFINDLIPIGLSRLFFFDGEKIQNLAEDSNDTEQLANSFKSLLGVDLVEKLMTDLEIYSVKQLKKNGGDEIKTKIGEFEKEQEILELQLDTQLQQKAQIQAKLDKIKVDIERQEDIIKSEGGSFAKKREELNLKKAILDQELGTVEQELREFSADILPFAFAKKLCLELKETLIKEEATRNNEITKKNLFSKIKNIEKNIEKDIAEQDKNLSKEAIKTIMKSIVSNIESQLSSGGNQLPIHKLSTDDTSKLFYFIEKAMEDGPKILSESSKKHEKISADRHTVVKELNFAPDEEAISPMLNKIKKINQEFGALQQELRGKEEEITKTKFNLENVQRTLKRKIEELKDEDGFSNRANIVSKVQKVLQEYYAQLKETKIQEFSEVFIKSFNEIARKKNIFYKAELDPITYSVTLYRNDNHKVPKVKLSAGEKQVYAIAVLWSLIKMSRRPLPFIVDTPLARLDRRHRDNIVLDFFPSASHQLVILSTDTEIDDKYIPKLEKFISKKYLLDYEDGKTEIKEGYFCV